MIGKNTLKPRLAKRSKADRRGGRDRVAGKLHNVPDLPQHYLPRSTYIDALKRALSSGADSPLALTAVRRIGMQGTGGIGKSVLAAALIQDDDVRRMFPDGLYWVVVGQTPNLLDLQNQLLRQLVPMTALFATTSEAKTALREALEPLRALIVLDDIWTAAAVDALCISTADCRFLITTRNNDVLIAAGALEHSVDVLLPSEALAMLGDWAGTAAVDLFAVEAAEIAAKCGFLPLAIASIGAIIRQRPTAWHDVLERLRRTDLDRFARAFPGYPYPHLLRAIEVSIDALDPEDRECYLDLAVFPEDYPVPEMPLCALWSLDSLDTRDCMARLASRSLATLLVNDGGDGYALVLHDLRRDVIRKKRAQELPALHERLARCWQPFPEPGDSYSWRFFALHLIGAGEEKRLKHCLTDFRYIASKLKETGPIALIGDYDFVLDDHDLRTIKSALVLSSPALTDERQLASQLMGRLLDIPSPVFQTLVAQAADATQTWLKPLTASLIRPGGALVRILAGHLDEVMCVAITADQRHIISGSEDGGLIVWDLADGRLVRNLIGHTQGITSIAAAPDGQRVVSSSFDGSIHVWDIASGEVSVLKGHRDMVTAVSVTCDGRFALSASLDHTVRKWDLTTRQTIRGMKNTTSDILSIAVMADGRHSVLMSREGELFVWDIDDHTIVRSFRTGQHQNNASHCAAMPDGRHVILSSENVLEVWDSSTGKLAKRFGYHRQSINSLAVSGDGAHVISASQGPSRQGTLWLWDLASGQMLREYQSSSIVWCVAVTADARYAVAGMGDRTLRLWDIGIRDSTPTPGHVTSPFREISATPDGRSILTVSNDDMLGMYDALTGDLRRTFNAEAYLAESVVIVPDGRHAVTAHPLDCTIRIIDLQIW